MFLLGEPKRVRHSPFLRLLGVCIMEYVTCARILVARKLSYDSRHEYVRLYKDAHLRKYDVQIRAMRRGLLEYLPAALLPLWNGFDLELAVAGEPEIDVDKLKAEASVSLSGKKFSKVRSSEFI